MPDYSRHTEQELIQLFIAGDDTAFKEIYQRYDKPLYLYAYHKLGDKEESRDMVQDVFSWLLTNRTNLDLRTTLSGYLYKAVLNKIYNSYKHNQVLQKYIDAGNQYIDLESTGTDYLIREKDIMAMIQKEISAMPPAMRAIYELKSKKYLSAKEISAELGIAESTVNTQLKRAMRHLKLNLKLFFLLVPILVC